MWATEYLIEEHRKDMVRVAAQMRLVRQARAERPPVTRWLTRLFSSFRRSQPTETEILRETCPQSVPLGRVS